MTHHKALVLFFPFNLLSHYTRCLQLAHAIHEQYEIRFVHSEKYAGMVREHGYGTFACEEFDAGQVMECTKHFDFSWLNSKSIERVFLSQVNAIEKYKPVLVIGDVASTLKMAAEKTDTPYLALVNGYMSKYYALMRKISSAHPAARFSGHIPAKIFDFITVKAEAYAFKQIHIPFRQLRKKYALNKTKSYLDELEGDHTVIADLPELFPLKKLPHTYTVIGPLFYMSTKEEKEVLRFISNGKPTIIASMGCTGDWNKLNFLNESCFYKYNIVAAGDINAVLHGTHICNRPFMNTCAVLPYADLMICHGGNGSIYQALSHGIPLLCFPDFFEQEWNAYQIQSQKLGLMLKGNETCNDLEKLTAYWINQKGSRQFAEIKSKIDLLRTKTAFKNVIENWP